MLKRTRRHGKGGRVGQHFRATPNLRSFDVPPAGDVTVKHPDGTIEVQPAQPAIMIGRDAGAHCVGQHVPEVAASSRSDFLPWQAGMESFVVHGQANSTGACSTTGASSVSTCQSAEGSALRDVASRTARNSSARPVVRLMATTVSLAHPFL